MVKSNTPRLCGGIFFVLLLQAKTTRSDALNTFQRKQAQAPYSKLINYHKINGVSDTDMSATLISIMDPSFSKPRGDTLTQSTSNYKSCKLEYNEFLQFNVPTIINAFNDKIINNYSEPLRAMSVFTSIFISVQHVAKCNQLVKALLELIQTDDSINAEDLFYILEDGKPITKNAISSLADICLQSFILGIWHFIVMNRRDNTIGQNTFTQWHKAPETKGQSHTFISNIGDGITRPISIKMLDLDNITTEPEPEVTVEDDATDSSEEPFTDNPRDDTRSQIMNNPIVFNQNGNNNLQIGNIGNLTINN